MKKLDQITIESTHTSSQLISLTQHLQINDSQREAALNHILTLEQELNLLETKYAEIAEAFEANALASTSGDDIRVLEKRLQKKQEEMEETDEKYLEVRCIFNLPPISSLSRPSPSIIPTRLMFEL